MMRTGLVFLFLGFVFSSLRAQSGPAAVDSTAFLTELESFMTSGKQEVMIETFNAFAAVYSSAQLAAADKENVRLLLAGMRQRRLAASPYFKAYLQATTQAAAAGGTSFQPWHAVLLQMFNDTDNYRANNFLSFLEFSVDFFTNQSLRFLPNAVSWKINSLQYSWRYQQQPVLQVAATDLIAFRREDSIRVKATAGAFLPVSGTWKGQGGSVNWAGTRLGAAVYADLASYQLDVRTSLLEVDTATLHFPQFLGNRTTLGSFSHKIVSDTTRATFPRFTSFENSLSLQNVGEGIQLRGGLRIEGGSIYATGTRELPARLAMYGKNLKPYLIADGNSILLRSGEKITGSQLRTSVYFNQDSLYHPSIGLVVDLATKEIQLNRGRTGADRNPFFHSFHKFTIDASEVAIFPDRDSMVIGRPLPGYALKQDVAFESYDFYNPAEYLRIQNTGTANPIAIMKATADREGTNVMPAALLASRINSRFTVESIQPLLYDLMAKGFIYYDAEKQLVEIKDKVFRYVEASQNNGDYDLIRIVSQSEGINATVSLSRGNTLLEGVESIVFSPKNRVAARPVGGQFLLKADRNLDFDGRLFAGYTRMEGKGLHFNYQDFAVRLDSVRYFDLFEPIDSFDSENRRQALSIGSRIEHLTGVLLIDAPGNKSGKETIPMFPSLQSKGFSYVYYDQASDQQGIYPRDSFYFKINPFSFSKLNNYEVEDIRFAGVLESAGIFRPVSETLVLRKEDKSLGFVSKTAATGEDVYGGKGRYAGAVDLSNRGLLGTGNLRYLGASINAEDINFFPKQTLASADRFDLEEVRTQPEVPQVRGVDVKIDWRPYQDSMYVRSEVAGFDLYKSGQHIFDGTLILTPGGLKGDGSLRWPQATMQSALFDLGAFSARADTMGIKINALEGDDRIALQSDNMNGKADFDTSFGSFASNGEALDILLPYNQYQTSMGGFDWDMKGELITMKPPAGRLGLFTSTHPDQDGLNFEGEKATYNLRTSALHVTGVPYVIAADAFIYPDSQVVDIDPAASMRVLNNARIIADTLNQYHVFNRAVVTISGKRRYNASGYYEYNLPTRAQEIFIQNIVGQPVGKGLQSQRNSITRATADIEPADSLFIDRKTRFYGTMSLSAEAREILFDGYARIDAEKLPGAYWFRVTSPGDKNNLIIPFDVPASDENEPLHTGFFLSKESAEVYPRVMMPLQYRKDRPVLPVKGFFDYDEERDVYIFGDSVKVVTKDGLRGNKLEFNNRTGNLTAEGRFELGSGLKYCSMEAVGTIEGVFPPPVVAPKPAEPQQDDNMMMMADEPTQEETQAAAEVPPPVVNVDWMAGLVFNMPDNLLSIIANDLKSATYASRLITYITDLDYHRKAFANFFPPGKDQEEALSGLSLGFIEFPKRMVPQTFVFSRLKMQWNRDYQSFVSMDKQNGLISVNGESIGKMVETYVELRMPSDDDDRLYLYIKSPSELFYFIGYKQGILSLCSNNPEFMRIIEGMKDKDRVVRMPDGETYEIQAVELSTATTFLRRAQAAQTPK